MLHDNVSNFNVVEREASQEHGGGLERMCLRAMEIKGVDGAKCDAFTTNAMIYGRARWKAIKCA